MITDLGTLGGSYSNATAINAAGHVAGYSTTATGAYHAFLYSNGAMTDLGPLGGQSYGLAMNESDQVTGYLRPATGDFHAFLYGNGAMTDAGTPSGLKVSEGEAINGSGNVVGRSYTQTTTSYAHRAFLYDAVNGMVDLGTLGGPWTSYGAIPAINTSGQVVGNSMTADGTTHAFLYDNGVMKLMVSPSPGWQNLVSGAAINDNGQIAGYGYFNGEMHAFVTSVVSLQNQTISFGTAPSLTYGGGTGTVSATATSGLPVAFSLADASGLRD